MNPVFLLVQLFGLYFYRIVSQIPYGLQSTFVFYPCLFKTNERHIYKIFKNETTKFMIILYFSWKL